MLALGHCAHDTTKKCIFRLVSTCVMGTVSIIHNDNKADDDDDDDKDDEIDDRG